MSLIARVFWNRSILLPRASASSSSGLRSKWSSIDDFPRPITTITCPAPAFTASSTISWMVGVSTMGSISFGTALVAGRNRVPRPAAGMTTLRKGCFMAAGKVAKGSDAGQPGYCRVHAMYTWIVARHGRRAGGQPRPGSRLPVAGQRGHAAGDLDGRRARGHRHGQRRAHRQSGGALAGPAVPLRDGRPLRLAVSRPGRDGEPGGRGLGIGGERPEIGRAHV